jgi:capsular exopolysaccharide synthesis family protein
LLGGVVGILIGLFVAAARDATDRRLRNQDEIKELADVPLLGQVGKGSLGRVAAPTGDDMDDVAAEAFRIIRTNLEFLAGTSPLRTIVVTSAVAEEGKTTVATSLAAGLSAAGKRTLLIDCDLRRPAVADRLGIEAAPGLTDYLSGSSKPEDVLQIAPLPGTGNQNGSLAGLSVQPLACISAGTRHPYPAELLSDHARLSGFLRETADVYDAVVIDSSPLLPVADTLELLPHIDCVLLCVRSSITSRDQLLAAKESLARFPQVRIGLVITGVDERSTDGYYAGYYYAKQPSQPHRLRRRRHRPSRKSIGAAMPRVNEQIPVVQPGTVGGAEDQSERVDE